MNEYSRADPLRRVQVADVVEELRREGRDPVVQQPLSHRNRVSDGERACSRGWGSGFGSRV